MTAAVSTDRSMSEKITAVKGMNDLLPPDSARWEWLEAQVRSLMAGFAYQNVRTPIVEPTALFVRGLGEVTDIVEKEMYTFVDQMNGESLTLRPEGTASCVRAVIEHNLLYPGPQRLCYAGPMFRHERPQSGRFRQFHQVDVEAVGSPGPAVDAEVVALLQKEVDDQNSSLGNFERIKKFTLLPSELTIEKGEITPTMKLKRKVINNNFATLIEEMYKE